MEEFHSYLGMPVTKFSERVFGILDADGSGSLSFEEFSVGVWNYCTYDVRLVTKLAFDIFGAPPRRPAPHLYRPNAATATVAATAATTTHHHDHPSQLRAMTHHSQRATSLDVDHLGKLDIPECDALIRMVRRPSRPA